jgi:MFS family permease
MGGNQSDNIQFGIMIHTLAVGSAVLWLLAHRCAACGRRRILAAAMVVALAVGLVSGLSMGIGSGETLIATAFVAVIMIATVLGYALAVRGYHARRAWRFLVWQAVGTVALSLTGVLIVALISLLILGGAGSTGVFLVFVILGGLITGFIAFLIALPFTILGLCSPFFRQRLIRCLGEEAPA